MIWDLWNTLKLTVRFVFYKMLIIFAINTRLFLIYGLVYFSPSFQVMCLLAFVNPRTEERFFLDKFLDKFIFSCVRRTIFPWRPYTRTSFLVEKLAWPAFQPGSLSRETCQFLAVNKRANKTCQEKIACPSAHDLLKPQSHNKDLTRSRTGDLSLTFSCPHFSPKFASMSTQDDVCSLMERYLKPEIWSRISG